MDPQIYPKIDVWASEGRIFAILGRFLRSRIFDEFSIGKKSTKNRHLSAKVVQKAKFSEARRNVRSHWGTIGGSRTWRFGKEFGMRFDLEFLIRHAVFPHEGGGGFKAQARIPPGLRKDLPKGGVVLLFPRSSLRCFVVSSFRRSLCRGVVVLPMGCTTSRRRNLLKSIKNLAKIY